jgi:hypothetical protein
MDGQIKVGLRNMFIVLLFVIILVPLTKNGVAQAPWIPAPIRNWILAV